MSGAQKIHRSDQNFTENDVAASYFLFIITLDGWFYRSVPAMLGSKINFKRTNLQSEWPHVTIFLIFPEFLQVLLNLHNVSLNCF